MKISFPSHGSLYSQATANRAQTKRSASEQDQASSTVRPPNKNMEQLLEQKQSLTERRSNYLSNALKKGTKPDTIKAELEEMDRQIQEINEKIQKELADQQSKAATTDEASKKELQEAIKKKKGELDPQTPEEQKKQLNLYTMNTVLQAKNELNTVAAVQTAQSILKTEAMSLEHSNPSKAATLLAKVDKLTEKMTEISQSVNSRLSEAAERNEEVLDTKAVQQNPEEESSPGAEWTEQELQAYRDAAKDDSLETGSVVDTIV